MKKSRNRIKALVLAALLALGQVIFTAKTASAFDFSKYYIDPDNIHVKSVLERMERIGLTQGVLYKAWVAMDRLDENSHDYGDIQYLEDEVFECDMSKACQPEEGHISLGMYLEEVLSGDPDDGQAKYKNLDHMWEAIGIVLEIGSVDDVVKGNDVWDGLYERNVVSCGWFWQEDCVEYVFRGRSEAGQMMLDRFNYIREKNGWEEVAEKDKWETSGEDPKSMDYFTGMAGYGLYRQEIINYCVVPENSDKPRKTVTWTSYDEQADDGSLKEVEIEIYDDAHPGGTNGEYLSFTSWGNGKTCEELVEHASEIAVGTYKDNSDPYTMDEVYRMLLNKTCNHSFKRQYEAAKKNDSEEPDEKELAENQIAEYEKLEATAQSSTEDYPWMRSKTDESGNIAPGYQCIDVDYLSSPVQVYTDPDIRNQMSTEESCYSSGGALTWIVCPLIRVMSDVVTGIYETWIEPNLIFDSSYLLYIGGNNAGNRDNPKDPEYATSISDRAILVRQFWNYFRMLANILIILLFLVVIASQVTGLGIDNYGIKKLLPKIIIISILVNLSYYISLLAIDAANVSGKIVEDLIDTLNKHVVIGESSAKGLTGSLVLGGVLTVIVSSVVVAGVVSQGWAILIPVIAALITAVIGIITLFAVLALRIVIIWTCVALSGIAIASCILPNTKKLFNIWLNFFWKALLCYPICSAVVYGGQLMSRIVIAVTGSSPSSLIIAIFLSVGPLVMLPTIIKSSFSMARNVVAAMDRTKMRLQGRAAMAVHGNRYGREYLANRAEKQMKERIKRKAGYAYNAKTGQYENRYGIRGRTAQNTLDDPNATAAQKERAQKLLDSIDAKRANYRMKAEGIIAHEGAQEQYYGEGGLLRVNQLHGASRMKVSQQQAASAYNHGDFESLGAELRKMIVHGQTDGDSILKRINTDDGSSAYKAAGIMMQMGATSKGRERLAEILREATSNENTTEDSKKAIRRVMSTSLQANPDFIKSIGIEGEDVIMAQYLEDSYHGKQSAEGSFDEWGKAIAEAVYDENGNLDSSRSKTNTQIASERALKKPSVLIGQGDAAVSDIINSGLLTNATYRNNLRNTILRGDWSEKGSQLSKMISAYSENATGEELTSFIQTGRLSSADQSTAITQLTSKSQLPATEISRLISDRDFKPAAGDLEKLSRAMEQYAETASLGQLVDTLTRGTFTNEQARTIQRKYQVAVASRAATPGDRRTIGEAYLRSRGGQMENDENGTPYTDAAAMVEGMQNRSRSTNTADAQIAKAILQKMGQAYIDLQRGRNS